MGKKDVVGLVWKEKKIRKSCFGGKKKKFGGLCEDQATQAVYTTHFENSVIHRKMDYRRCRKVWRRVEEGKNREREKSEREGGKKCTIYKSAATMTSASEGYTRIKS